MAALASGPRNHGRQQRAERDRNGQETANLLGREVVQQANSLLHGQGQAPEGEQRGRQGAGCGDNIIETAVAVGKGEQREHGQERPVERRRAIGIGLHQNEDGERCRPEGGSDYGAHGRLVDHAFQKSHTRDAAAQRGEEPDDVGKGFVATVAALDRFAPLMRR